MNIETNEIMENINYQALMSLLEEQHGKGFVLRNSDMFYLWYCVQRNQVSENKTKMIQFLKENKIISEKRHIASTVNRYFKFRNYLPYMKDSTKKKLDRANEFFNTLVNFERVDDMFLGVLRNENLYSVVNISNGTEEVVAILMNEGSVSLRNDSLSTNQIEWIKKIKGVIL